MVTYIPNLKSLSPSVTKIAKAIQNTENGVATCHCSVTEKYSIIRYSTYEFLLTLYYYVPVLHHFSDIARYWSKTADFMLPDLLWRSCRGDRIRISPYLWHHNTSVHRLLCRLVCVILCLAGLVELRLMTDRETDRQTDTWPQHIPC